MNAPRTNERGSIGVVDERATLMVYIIKTWPAEPTFHAYGRIREETDVTACGLLLYDGQNRYNALLRLDHAELFAKPCTRCFPEADDA